jgi:hypothetical protein
MTNWYRSEGGTQKAENRNIDPTGFGYWRPQRNNSWTYSDLIGKLPVASGYTTPNLQGDGIDVSIGITRSKYGQKRTGKRLQY